MAASSQACSEYSCDSIVTRECLERAIGAALQEVCRSINHTGAIAFAVTSDLDIIRCDLNFDQAPMMSAKACVTRRASWVRGRAAAHQALKRLGMTARAPISRSEQGEPIWPRGISGSITHCSPWSIAVATESFGSVFLGIDLENANRIQEFGIESVICRSSERVWIHEDCDALERLCRLFSAKEALYKSLFSSYRRYIDFNEVELSWSAADSAFYVAASPQNNPAHGRSSVVASHRYNDLIFSCAAYTTQ